MASRIFLSPPEPKDPRVREAPYLGWVAALPCVACLRLKGKMNREVQVAHLRESSAAHSKQITGMATKPSDAWSSPLCLSHHVGDKRSAPFSQHDMSETEFWIERLGINPFDLCIELHDAYLAGQPPTAGVNIISRHVGEAMRRTNR